MSTTAITAPRRLRRLAALAAVAAGLAGSAAAADAAQAAYQYVGYDVISVSTGRAATWHSTATPHVIWHRDGGVFTGIHRGEIRRTFVSDYTATPNQCIAARVEWRRLALSPVIGYPPSVGVGTSFDGSGWVTSCRQAGQRHPATIVLSGAAYASRALIGARIQVCHLRAANYAWGCSGNNYAN